jgi:hypothetical protein
VYEFMGDKKKPLQQKKAIGVSGFKAWQFSPRWRYLPEAMDGREGSTNMDAASQTKYQDKKKPLQLTL